MCVFALLCKMFGACSFGEVEEEETTLFRSDNKSFSLDNTTFIFWVAVTNLAVYSLNRK